MKKISLYTLFFGLILGMSASTFGMAPERIADKQKEIRKAIAEIKQAKTEQAALAATRKASTLISKLRPYAPAPAQRLTVEKVNAMKIAGLVPGAPPAAPPSVEKEQRLEEVNPSAPIVTEINEAKGILQQIKVGILKAGAAATAVAIVVATVKKAYDWLTDKKDELTDEQVVQLTQEVQSLEQEAKSVEDNLESKGIEVSVTFDTLLQKLTSIEDKAYEDFNKWDLKKLTSVNFDSLNKDLDGVIREYTKNKANLSDVEQSSFLEQEDKLRKKLVNMEDVYDQTIKQKDGPKLLIDWMKEGPKVVGEAEEPEVEEEPAVEEEPREVPPLREQPEFREEAEEVKKVSSEIKDKWFANIKDFEQKVLVPTQRLFATPKPEQDVRKLVLNGFDKLMTDFDKDPQQKDMQDMDRIAVRNEFKRVRAPIYGIQIDYAIWAVDQGKQAMQDSLKDKENFDSRGKSVDFATMIKENALAENVENMSLFLKHTDGRVGLIENYILLYASLDAGLAKTVPQSEKGKLNTLLNNLKSIHQDIIQKQIIDKLFTFAQTTKMPVDTRKAALDIAMAFVNGPMRIIINLREHLADDIKSADVIKVYDDKRMPLQDALTKEKKDVQERAEAEVRENVTKYKVRLEEADQKLAAIIVAEGATLQSKSDETAKLLLDELKFYQDDFKKEWIQWKKSPGLNFKKQFILPLIAFNNWAKEALKDKDNFDQNSPKLTQVDTAINTYVREVLKNQVEFIGTLLTNAGSDVGVLLTIDKPFIKPGKTYLAIGKRPDEHVTFKEMIKANAQEKNKEQIEKLFESLNFKLEQLEILLIEKANIQGKLLLDNADSIQDTVKGMNKKYEDFLERFGIIPDDMLVNVKDNFNKVKGLVDAVKNAAKI